MEVYDSAATATTVRAKAERLWRYRGLVRLLVGRNLTVRYKRSVLGVWWTLLNPMLMSGVMWIVFSRIFRFATPGVPYVVYLVAGVLFGTFVIQGTTQTAYSITASRSVLTKMYVPPEAFAFASAFAAAVHFVVGLVPLLAIQVATGVGIPWTVLLVPLPLVAALAFIVGIGLLVAAGAVLFYDVFDITAVALQAIGYLTPTFYPVEIVPGHLMFFLYANPLYSYLIVFRGFLYEGSFAPAWAFVIMILTAVVTLYIGMRTFARSWRNLVVLL